MTEEGGMVLLPPPPGVCQKCAVDHSDDEPHNQESLHWQYWFFGQNGRWPTWKDAIDHCSEETKALWTEELKEHGIEI